MGSDSVRSGRSRSVKLRSVSFPFQRTRVTRVTRDVFHAFLGAICERPLLCCCVPLCSLTHRTLRRIENKTTLSLSVSPSVTQVRGFFPLTFRVSSASGLFFTLVCSTYLLTSRVLVNVGFVQTWCLVECDSRLCLSEIFFFFKPFKPRECLTLSCCIS